MQYKQIAVLWKKEDDNKESYFSGDLDLGAFGRVRIAVHVINHKKLSHDPDATVHVEVQEYEN